MIHINYNRYILFKSKKLYHNDKSILWCNSIASLCVCVSVYVDVVRKSRKPEHTRASRSEHIQNHSRIRGNHNPRKWVENYDYCGRARGTASSYLHHV